LHAAQVDRWSPPSNPYHHEDDKIQLSFDQDYHSLARPTASPTRPETDTPPPVPPKASPVERAATLQRPELKSSNTMPVMGLEHNAWADEDDEFKEKEMEMTFA
jgi:hypothetical protein